MRTLWLLVRAGFHTCLLFALPWLLGALVGVAFDIDEVTETSGRFATLFSLVVVPLLVLQVVAIAMKIGRELRLARADGRSKGATTFVEALDKHARVLTGRGVGMAGVSLVMVGLALAAKWGQFGVIAVAGLGLMYIASTAATIASAFSVRAFDARVVRGRGSIEREMSPTVVEAGDAVEERFVLARVPVPPGFRLHIEEELPARLGGDTRFALDRTVSRSHVTVSAPLPRTPRGVYRVGPASIWYEDVLGLTRVHVAARASASLRSLPRLRPIAFERRPQSWAKSDGPLSVLSKLATEEHFRTRPYVSGDDLRRVHWKQSINVGQLMVRLPESVPFAPTKVRLVLDTFLPPQMRAASVRGHAEPKSPESMGEVMDLLVEAWVALAHALMRRGEQVTLVAPVRDDGVTQLREIECKRGEERKWRAIGADADWQLDLPLGEVLARATPHGRGTVVVVTSGLGMEGLSVPPATTFVIADGASVVTTPPPDEWGVVRRFFFFDYPVGAEDNKVDWGRLLRPHPTPPAAVQRELARVMSVALGLARACSAPVQILRREGPTLSLRSP